MTIPKLRFPEFRDAGEWEINLLGHKKISKFVNDRIALDQLNLDTYVSTENLLPDYAGVTRASKLPPSGSCTRYRKGDVLVSNIRPYLKKVWSADRSGASSNDVIVIRSGEEVIADFLTFVLKNDQFINYVMAGSKGVKMPRGDISSMKEYLVAFPKPDEQRKIAECLASLDDRITAETQKLEALRAHKKGLMQQLFPAAGQTLPQLRFPEFRDMGEWAVRKLSEVLIEQVRPIEMDKEHIYSLVTVKRRYGGVVVREKLKGNSIKVKTQFLLKEKDFLISKRQIVHCACGLVPKALEGSIVSNEYSVLGVRDGFNILFFDYFSQQMKVSQSFLDCSVGIVIEKMLFKLNDWLKQEFLFPSLTEQQKIADCLSSLDELIALQAQKIDALKLHKKGLMQQLFPSVEEVSK